jgi:hypothetical protein
MICEIQKLIKYLKMINTRFLSDKDILKWNDRFISNHISVYPKYGSTSLYPMIVFKHTSTTNWITQDVITLDPNERFKFQFSVSKNRVDNFFHLFNKWFSTDIGNQTYYEFNGKEKIDDIKISHLLVKLKEEETHKISEKEYTKFTYHFEGKLSQIMGYVNLLEDTISIFSKIWGYDEEGNEHQLLKYSIGDIVSIKGKNHEDYLILDYRISKDSNNKFSIDYEISKIIIEGCVIKYDSPMIEREKNLTWSRDNRIDDILN